MKKVLCYLLGYVPAKSSSADAKTKPKISSLSSQIVKTANTKAKNSGDIDGGDRLYNNMLIEK